MYTIGIDLGGTNIVSSVVDENYKIVATSKTPTASPRTAEEIFDDIAMVSFEALKKAGLTIDDIDSIGMGTPGTVNADGIIEFANNLGFNNVPAKQMLIERLGIERVFIENDANCAALGEAYAGVGKSAPRILLPLHWAQVLAQALLLTVRLLTVLTMRAVSAVIWLLLLTVSNAPVAVRAAGRLMLRQQLLSDRQKWQWRNTRILICTRLRKLRVRCQAELLLMP